MRKIYEILGKIELYIAEVLLFLIVVLVFSAGVSRTLKNPIYWANPLASFFFAWATMFAMDAAYRRDKLMNVDFLVKRFPQKIQSYIKIFNYLVILAFLIFLIVFGVKLAFIQRYRTFEGMYGFSYMWATLSIPVGSLLLSITTLVKIIDEITNLRRWRKELCS
ncbi:MAG: TRAP transporter small permease [Dictyoglomus thermophilum]|uniref:TRAP transporter small permease n=1 Tax=Dictyoglomus thermophilum TaxID=14 RepID=A0A7V4DY82_DICTH|nr:TRAP transporter small permease [Dictyoglomus thermophilum]MCX7720531.1 TRAP transporter small permease [Dictyoglomus thermophilum]TYT24312.1 TRAP transporter small permease [Dictyoglomus thermophilum]